MIKVLPITTNEKDFPLHVSLPERLPVHGKVLLDHERTIDSFSPERACKYKCAVPDDFVSDVMIGLNLHIKKVTNDNDKAYILVNL